MQLSDKIEKLQNSNCELCDLCKDSEADGKHLVCLMGKGDTESPIVFVGEALGKTEVLLEEPFVGDAGHLLNLAIQDAGYDRSQVWVSNCVKCRPKNNETPKSKHIKACRPYLEEELKLLKPKAICVLGNPAMESVLKIKGITKYRGEEIWSDEFQCNVYPVYHPAYVLRDNTHRDVFFNDIRNVLDKAFNKEEVKQSDKNYYVVKTIEEFRKAKKFLLNEKELAVDTETFLTDPLEGNILCVGFSWEEGSALTVPLCGQNMAPIWEPSEQKEINEGIGEILYSSKLILQNGKYDMQFFIVFGYDRDKLFENWVSDPMLLHHILDENSNHGLDDLTLKYTDMGAYYNALEAEKDRILKEINKGKKKKILKSEFTYDLFPTEILWFYQNSDADATYRVNRRLLRELKKYPELELLYENLTMPLAKVLTVMEMNGVKIDQERLEVNITKLQKRLEEVDAKLRSSKKVKQVEDYFVKQAIAELKEHYDSLKKKKISWEEYQEKYIKLEEYAFNFSSAKQLGVLFYDALKLEEIVNPKTGRPTLDRKALEIYAEKHPFCNELLEYRNLQQFLSTFLIGIQEKIGSDGRIHTSFLQHGTVTGRMSSRDPNLQNIPKRKKGDVDPMLVRESFIADDGCKIVEADFCLPSGTMISTSEGLKRIENIKIGDRVIQETGGLQKVIATKKVGIKKCFKLITKLGYEIEATDNEKFRVLNSEGNYVWKYLRDIKLNDVVCLSENSHYHNSYDYDNEVYKKLSKLRYTHPNNKICIQVPNYLNTRFGCLLGYLIGDGSFNTKHFSFVVNQQDKDVWQALNKLINKCFNAKVMSKTTYRGVIEGRVFSVPLLNYLQNELGINKSEVPACIVESNPTVIASFLRGLFEADGCVTRGVYGRISYASSRQKIVKQVHSLLLSLGIVSNYMERSTKDGFNVYSIAIPATYIEKFNKIIGFMSVRKQRRLNTLVKSKNTVHSGSVGSMPNLQKKLKAVTLHGNTSKLLQNAKISGRAITKNLAIRLKKENYDVYDYLGLEKLIDYKILFDSITKIESTGEQEVFDIQVDKTHTFIANGFIVHNCQLEWRIFADTGKDPLLMEDVRNGVDVHAKMAFQVYGVTPESPDYKDKRRLAKDVVFGTLYGESAWALSRRLKIPQEEAEAIQKAFFEEYPDAFGCIDYYRDLAVHQGWVENYFGRRRRFPLLLLGYNEQRKREWGECLRQAFNFRIQGTAGDLTSFAMIRLDKKIRELGIPAKMLIQIHDAIIWEVSDEYLNQLCELIRREMPKQVAGIEAPLGVEIEYGDRWSEMKKWEPEKKDLEKT